ncbi:PREDICTED: probable fructose-bisphosphate aldolase 2, chloroplastic [Erythranthe guttata]|uniref:probable fructose-bisphosphate aldolase 2, chloroplastic n=1 Tax=Erythranthe guttata TaxID=4155 RepID=UPI00064D8C99|nr:PREDICTED: probable fructose-bisphosphate aldolase 2, chloroplastic [Erythranthe guttata]|eukprot:XP_012857512.1 PREDICTED: probable fructose-bisphosphate aldolase 2, chloroplastic [Erythranthe guttata]
MVIMVKFLTAGGKKLKLTIWDTVVYLAFSVQCLIVSNGAVVYDFLSGGLIRSGSNPKLERNEPMPEPVARVVHVRAGPTEHLPKTWGGRPENMKAAQDALLLRASANSLAQLGKYTGEGESEEAKKGMFVKGYSY